MADQDQTYPVAIVGAGPVGLSLALGLARLGIRSAVLEKNASTTRRSRAPGIHARTLEIFRQWGILDAVQSAGILVREATIYDARTEAPLLHLGLDSLAAEVQTPAICLLEQAVTEKILLDAVQSSGMCDVFFESRVVDVTQHGDGVTLWNERLEPAVTARFGVACDGAGSTIRGRLGLPFEGFTYHVQAVLADVRLPDDGKDFPWPRVSPGRRDFYIGIRLQDGSWRVIMIRPGDPAKIRSEVNPAVTAGGVERLFKTGEFESVWSSAFKIHRRMAPRYRVGRVLLAGDAAHIHSPAGGQGMNTGIHDAHNLAWKLANALRGGDGDALLDSYEDERRYAIRHHVFRITHFNTRAVTFAPQTLLPLGMWLGRRLLSYPPVRKEAAGRVTMIRQPYGSSSLLQPSGGRAGHRMPDAVLRSPAGEDVRLFDLMGFDPTLLFFNMQPVDGLPCRSIRIGPGGFMDSADVLRKFLRMKRGAVLVRPDHMVGWMSRRPDVASLRGGVDRALGLSFGRTT